MNRAPFRPLRFGITRVRVRDGAPGTRYVQADAALPDFPARITDRFAHWAGTSPHRPFLARRARLDDGSTGDWQAITYGEAWQHARAIAQALIERRLNVERPVAILSENSLEHALLSLGCLLAGVPIAAGDKVVMYYGAANRDPAQFPDPERFDVGRKPNRHIAFGQVHHLIGHAHQRHGIAGQKQFTLPDAQHQGRTGSCAHDAVGFVAGHDRNGKSTMQLLDRLHHRTKQIARIKRVNQMHHHFGVGLTVKLIALVLQRWTQIVVVFNDAVVNNCNFLITIPMRMSVDIVG